MIKSIATALCLALTAGTASAVSLTSVDFLLVDIVDTGAFSGLPTTGTLTVTFDQDDPGLTLVPNVPSTVLATDVTLNLGGAVFEAFGDQEIFALADSGGDVAQTVSGVLAPTQMGQFQGTSLTYELNILFSLLTGFSATNSFFAAQDSVDPTLQVLSGVVLEPVNQVPLPATAWMLVAGLGALAARGRKT